MKRTKILSIFCAVAVLFAGATSLCGIGTAKAEEAGETGEAESVLKPIDMYLIAGQSNAAGYSSKGNLNESFENVRYAGSVDYSLVMGYGTNESVASFEDFKTSVTAGLGRSTNHIGPEYGMAKTLNDVYGEEKQAFIFKSAAGGTALRNVGALGGTDGSSMYGNWYPRSLWADGYVPGKTASDVTGAQYYRFVENFKTVYAELKANGYSPVIRGMAWMQGCDDLGYATEYESLLKTLIADIRSDLSEITGNDLSSMPFAIGKIATSFVSWNNPKVPAMNEVQQRVADTLVNVATVETSDLIIVNQYNETIGTDIYHFNTNDAVTLGQRFASALLKYGKRDTVGEISSENCVVKFSYDVNDNVVFSVTPYKNCALTQLTLNGTDVLSSLENGKLTVLSSESRLVLEAIGSERTKLSFTYNDLNGSGANYTERAFYCYEGDTLKVRLSVRAGYEIESVKLGDDAFAYNEETLAWEIVPEEGGDVIVTVKKKKSSNSGSNFGNASSSSSEEGKKTGCKSSISVGFVGLTALCASLVVLKKRK